MDPEENNDLTPNYTYVFQFEQQFQHEDAKEFMVHYWHTSFYAVVIYIIVIFGIQAYMKNRQAYRLKRLLTLWNTSLALFSIIGTIRTAPELLHVLSRFGFDQSVCNPSYVSVVKTSGFWTWMFALSKILELGDTVFIVLRKQNLIFLHWYHHITVLLYTWSTYSHHIGAGRWFVVMNFFVHSIMYSYYALRSMKFSIPRQISMVITISQIVQMILGAYVIGHAYYRRLLGGACHITHYAASFGLLMYLSYFALFAHFFYNAYFAGEKRAKMDVDRKEEGRRAKVKTTLKKE